jgi:beta-galactosidase/beta-glucuronidase
VTSIDALIRDVGQFIERDYNHPCIITWVTLNESWGVHRIKEDRKQKNFAKMLYHYVRCLDQTRMISSNDGWEQVNPTDISAIHDYDMTPANAGVKYSGDGVLRVLETNAQSKAMYADGEKYSGEPILITEYGGLMMEGSKGWGYQGVVKDEQEYLANIGKLTSSITANERICGFCYTQLTDVMQEVNGLLDENRNPKASIDKISRMFTL